VTGYSAKARNRAGLARSIKTLLGQSAYDAFKRTGNYDQSALDAARAKRGSRPKPAKEDNKASGPTRVTPAPKSQLVAGTKILSSNSKRPGIIQSKRQTKDGREAFLVKWDDGHGMGVMTPDRLIVVETPSGPMMEADSTNAQPYYDKLTKHGVLVDRDGLAKKITDTTTLRDKAQADLNARVGWTDDDFNPRSRKHIDELADQFQVERPRSLKDIDLATTFPDDVTKRITELKSQNKLLQDLNVIRRSIGDDGRIHPKWTEAATGRWYTGDPPIQTLAAGVREFLVPEPGHGFMTLDWDQHELRFLAKMTGDPDLQAIFDQGLDPHVAVFERITGTTISTDPKRRKEQRDVGKMLNYALVYGLGPEGLASRLNVSTEEATQLIDAHFTRFPVMANWIEKTIQDGFRNGFVTTIAGRKIPIDTSTGFDRKGKAARQAVNYTLQGSSADHLVDVVKRLDEMDALGPTVQATIHRHVRLQGSLAQLEVGHGRHQRRAGRLSS
jgi:hypothetical protein